MDNTLMVSVEILIDNIIDFSKSDIRNLLREQIEFELGRQFDDDFLIHEESIQEENINTGEIIKSIKFTSIIDKNIKVKRGLGLGLKKVDFGKKLKVKCLVVCADCGNEYSPQIEICPECWSPKIIQD